MGTIVVAFFLVYVTSRLNLWLLVSDQDRFNQIDYVRIKSHDTPSTYRF